MALDLNGGSLKASGNGFFDGSPLGQRHLVRGRTVRGSSKSLGPVHK
jgi:hypothetical protein